MPNEERKVDIMEKCYHPVSGELCYFATEDEKAIIDVALLYLISHSSEESGSE